jgi:hypothetical protein
MVQELKIPVYSFYFKAMEIKIPNKKLFNVLEYSTIKGFLRLGLRKILKEFAFSVNLVSIFSIVA